MKRDLYDREPHEWSDAELCGVLTQRYEASKIPPCPICGGALSIQSVGGGRATEWACSGYEDNPDDGTVRMQTGRTFVDEHYDKSRFTDYRLGGDDSVMELITRFRAKAGLK